MPASDIPTTIAVKSTGVSVLWFCASTCFQFWSKTYTMWENNFFHAWIDWLHVFCFGIGFRKTLVAFDFDGKVKQSIAQLTM